MPESKSSKLFGNAEELLDPETVLVTGKSLPAYVNGSLIRNGPGKFDLRDDFTVNNFYDGYSIISKYEISQGNIVKFTKKYLASEAHKRATIAGRPCMLEFCTKAYADPEKNLFVRHLPDILPVFSDNGNLGMYKMGEHYFTAAETCNFESIDPHTLNYVAKHDTNKTYGLGIVSPHPLTDPKTGTVYNVGASMLTGLKYHVLKVDPKGTLDDVFANSKSISCFNSSSFTKFGYAHSFGMTDNYVIFVEQPFTLSLPKLLGGSLSTSGACIKDWTEWRGHKMRNRFFIVDKHSGKQVDGAEIYAQIPFFFYHFVNCYEDGESLIVDIIAFPDDGIQDAFMLKNLRNPEINEGENLPQAHRFQIPLIPKLSKSIPEGINLNLGQLSTAKAVRKGKQILLESEPLSGKGVEFPFVNPKYVGQKYAYFYGTGYVTKMGSYQNSLCKVNVDTKKVTVWRESEHYFPSEPIFVPNPNGTLEDDGVLVVTVTDDRESAKDFLLFLDGQTMTEIGRATFTASVPLSIHGVFTPE